MQFTPLEKSLNTAQKQGQSWLEADDDSEDSRTVMCLKSKSQVSLQNVTHTKLHVLVLTLGKCEVQIKYKFNETKGFGNCSINT